MRVEYHVTLSSVRGLAMVSSLSRNMQWAAETMYLDYTVLYSALLYCTCNVLYCTVLYVLGSHQSPATELRFIGFYQSNHPRILVGLRQQMSIITHGSILANES